MRVQNPLAMIALVGVLLAPWSARAQSMVMEYDGTAYSVIKVGHARIEANMADGRYDAQGSLTTAGFAILFSDARALGKAHGSLIDHDVRPDRYELNHTYQGVRRDWLVSWLSPSVSVSTSPAFPFSDLAPPTEAQRREGRDPLSTILSMGASVAATDRCEGVFRVFDGLYIYDMILRDKGPGRYQHHDIDWPVRRCAIRQKRIAGYESRSDLAKELPESEIWFARRPGSPVAVLTRFSSHLPLGEATIALSSFSMR